MPFHPPKPLTGGETESPHRVSEGRAGAQSSSLRLPNPAFVPLSRPFLPAGQLGDEVPKTRKCLEPTQTKGEFSVFCVLSQHSLDGIYCTPFFPIHESCSSGFIRTPCFRVCCLKSEYLV